jgi:hypothetical protein
MIVRYDTYSYTHHTHVCFRSRQNDSLFLIYIQIGLSQSLTQQAEYDTTIVGIVLLYSRQLKGAGVCQAAPPSIPLPSVPSDIYLL